MRILVLPLRGKLENNSCLFVAVDNTIPKKQEGYNMMDFFDEKAKEFQELTLQASNLSKKDYEEALGFSFFFLLFPRFSLFFYFFGDHWD